MPVACCLLHGRGNACCTVMPKSRANSTDPGAVLAKAELHHPGGNWTRHNFSLTPTADAACVGIEPGSDPQVACTKSGSEGGPGHICVRCGAQFIVGLDRPGDAYIDYVMVQPGSWGRYKELPVLKETITNLLEIGVTTIRFGGSFVSYYGEYYFWKKWRGAPWTRPSVGAYWVDDVMGSWGPFEMLDMCEKAGIEPIITTPSQDQSPRSGPTGIWFTS